MGRRKLILKDSEHARSVIGIYVETYAHTDQCLEIRWKGISLPYRVFDPHQQHVTHAAIAENKRLGEVLSYVMAQQEAGTPIPGPVGKQRTRYTPKGQHVGHKRSWIDRRAEKRAAVAAAISPPVATALWMESEPGPAQCLADPPCPMRRF